MLNDEFKWITKPQEVYEFQKNVDSDEIEVLVEWKDLPAHKATWESYNTMQQQFPTFHLNVKVVLYPRVILGLLQFAHMLEEAKM